MVEAVFDVLQPSNTANVRATNPINDLLFMSGFLHYTNDSDFTAGSTAYIPRRRRRFTVVPNYRRVATRTTVSR